MTPDRIVPGILLLYILTTAATTASAGSHAPLGTGFIAAPREIDRAAAHGPRLETRLGGHGIDRTLAYPLYRWPLDRQLRDGLVLVNYVDHGSGAAITDYMGGPHAYDGHAGTDYSLYNFRLMDRGCGVRAAASGTVAYIAGVAPGAFDRSCDFNWPDDGNWVWIDHGDGTYHEYYHLRAWSMTVGPGEPVQTGQLLGLVGSSGYSTAPHLHFETGDYFGGPYLRRDPYTGPSNPLPSLWASQEDYAGDDPLWFADIGVFADAAVGGSVFNTTYCDTQEGIQAPAVFGIHEPHLDLWVQFQGQATDSFRIEIRHPNGTVWASFSDVIGYDAQFSWFWAYWFWDGAVTAADYGTWTARAYAGGSLSRQTSFEVGPATIYGPRLRKAGRSFRINGSVQRDTLRVRPLSSAVSFALSNAPPFVTLQDSVVTVGAASSQPTRSLFFQVVATDAAARRDTAWYHVVDMSKPMEPPVAVEEPRTAGARIALAAAPNPSRGSTAFEFVLPREGHAELAVYDPVGRRVRHLASGMQTAGRHRVLWDGRDAAGYLTPSGLYFARVSSGGMAHTLRFVLAR